MDSKDLVTKLFVKGNKPLCMCKTLNIGGRYRRGEMTMTGSLVRDKYNRDLHFKDALNVQGALENTTQISGWPSFVKKVWPL